MTEFYISKTQGLNLRPHRGYGRWHPALTSEVRDANDVLNGVKSVHPSERFFARLPHLTRPTGKPVSLWVPLTAVAIIGACALSSGVPYFLAVPAIVGAFYALIRLN